MTYFAELAPEHFGVFDRSFVTMFRIAAGEAWVEELPGVGDDGYINLGTVIFIISYVIIVEWTLLQVRCKYDTEKVKGYDNWRGVRARSQSQTRKNAQL